MTHTRREEKEKYLYAEDIYAEDVYAEDVNIHIYIYIHGGI